MTIQQPVTAAQAAMVRTWEAHVAAEFAAHDLEATMATMTAEPSVLHMGTMTGGVGAAAVRRFYASAFLPGHPPDVAATTVARAIGAATLIDQVVYRATHTVVMPWLLPGIAPTGAPFAAVFVAWVGFEGERIASERIFFDQASVLAQLGLLDRAALPIVGAEAADALSGAPLVANQLIERAAGRRP